MAIKGTNWGGSDNDNPAVSPVPVDFVDTAALGDVVRIQFGLERYVVVGAQGLPVDVPRFHSPSQILEELLDEAQARGDWLGWTVKGSALFDEMEEFVARVGDTYLQVIDSLSSDLCRRGGRPG